MKVSHPVILLVIFYQVDGKGYLDQVQDISRKVVSRFHNGLEELGNVGQVLFQDIGDGFKTMAKARIDDYVPNLNEEISRQSYQPKQGLTSALLRMVGLDEHKIGMMVLNMLVYMAEYFAKNFLGMESELGNEIPEYRALASNQGVVTMMMKVVENANAKSDRIKNSLFDPELPTKMIEMIPNKFLEQDTSCVQLFLCKLEPALWSVQTTSKTYRGFSLRQSLNSNLNKFLNMVYIDLPDLKSLRQFGKRCDEQYSNCKLLKGF